MAYYDNYINNTLSMGNDTSNQFVNYTQQWYNETFKNAPNYAKGATLNNNDVDIRVESTKAKLSSNKPDGEFKHILFMNLSLKINYGDYLNFWNDNWLVIDKKVSSPASNTCDVERCNQQLKFKNSQGNIVSIPCVCDSLGRMYLDVQTNKELILPKDIYLVKAQNNSDSLQIIESMRFIILGEPYKIMARTKIITDGIIEFKLQSDVVYEGDDLVNGLAYQTISQTITPTNLSIQGSTSLKINTQSIYNVINNTTGESFNFSIVDAISGNPTNSITIVSSTDTSIILKAGNIEGKICRLICVDKLNNSITTNMIITTNKGF